MKIYFIEIIGFNESYSINLTGTALKQNPTLTNSIFNLKQNNLTIINPIIDKIKFFNLNSGIKIINIYNLKGVLVSNSLDISHLNSGIYDLKLERISGDKVFKKIIKI